MKPNTREPMFLNPVLPLKTYVALNVSGHKLGEINDNSVKEAWEQARELYGKSVRVVHIKKP